MNLWHRCKAQLKQKTGRGSPESFIDLRNPHSGFRLAAKPGVSRRVWDFIIEISHSSSSFSWVTVLQTSR